MDADLIAALGGKAPLSVLLVTAIFPSHTARMTDGGFVVWGANTYEETDSLLGSVSDMEEIEDGTGDQATTWAMSVMAPPESLASIAAPEAQGSVITVHLGAVNRATGLLIGEPDLLQRVEFDVPRIGVGTSTTLDLDCITEEARMLEPNEERIQSDAFHQSVWPGELGYEHQTSAKVKIWWREDGPSV